jgi:hypothetical protein
MGNHRYLDEKVDVVGVQHYFRLRRCFENNMIVSYNEICIIIILRYKKHSKANRNIIKNIIFHKIIFMIMNLFKKSG